jgi:hypothetical protein
MVGGRISLTDRSCWRTLVFCERISEKTSRLSLHTRAWPSAFTSLSRYNLRRQDRFPRIRADRSLTPLSGSGLRAAERDAIFLAVFQTDQEAAFLNSSRSSTLGHGGDEYVGASGARSFAKLQAARQALLDHGRLVRPVDARALHNWRAGDPIPGSEVD